VSISQEEALKLLGHQLSSAELCLYEPELYGTFRLLDAASRLLGVLVSKDPASQDSFLVELKQEIDQKKTAVMYDPDGFRAFVQEVPGLVAERLKDYARAVKGE
jgi:hypothetical protein